MVENFWLALGLTALAGLSTGIGSIIAFFAKRTNYRFLSVATGFSAGVMLYVSFVEILPKAAESLSESGGESAGTWWATISFFGEILLILLIDRLIPSPENPHEVRDEIQDRVKLREAVSATLNTLMSWLFHLLFLHCVARQFDGSDFSVSPGKQGE